MALANYLLYCACLFVVGGSLGAFGPLVPYWSQQQNHQPTFYTVFIYSRTIVNLIGIIVCKLFQDKLSYHQILIMGLLFHGIFGVLFDLYDGSIIIRSIIYGLMFIGSSILDMITNIIVIQAYQGQNLQLAFTVFQSWFSIGALSISQIIKITQTNTYAFLAIMAIILIPITLMLSPPNINNVQRQQQQQQIQQNTKRFSLSNLSIFINCLSCFMLGFISMGFSSWISTYIVIRQLETKEGALIFNTFLWLSRIISSYIFPLIKGKTQRKINALSLFGFASPILSLVLIYHVNSYLGLAFGCIMVGMPITVMMGLVQCQFQDYGFMISQKQLLLVFFIMEASEAFSAELVKMLCVSISWEMLFYTVSALYFIFQITIIFQGKALETQYQRIMNQQQEKKLGEPQSQSIEVQQLQ